MEFKDKVKYVRKQLKLTQVELAKQLGVDFSTINKWENGVYQPQLKKENEFNQFCKNHNLDFDELSQKIERLNNLNLKFLALEAEKNKIEKQIQSIILDIIVCLKAR